MATTVAEKLNTPEHAGASQPHEGEVILPGAGPVAPLPVAPSPALRPRKKPIWLLIVLAVLAAGGWAGYRWWRLQQSALPAGFAMANGRLEAEEIDISTKFPGRIAQLLVDEGDQVEAGQVLARMDVRDLEASLGKAAAQEQAAERAIAEAKASQDQLRTQLSLAQAEFDRTSALVGRGYATHELFDQRRQGLDSAKAALLAAGARVDQAEHARDAASHDIELLKVNIADNTLVAPRPGRIQYRIADVGEVLAAGGKVFTMLDVSDVYMDLFLPTAEAGRAKFGSEGRIVLDAYPDRAIPAYVSFIATQAQFTPKAVETQSERDKLMFRIKLRVNADVLKAHAADVRSGLPGVGYLKLDPAAAWPEKLRGAASK